jgi:hypothetical protein
MPTHKELFILRLINKFNWSKPFATEYFMERNYNGLGHMRAFDNAMKSTFINEKDKPKGKWNDYQ